MKKNNIYMLLSLSLFFAVTQPIDAIQINKDKIRDDIRNTKINITNESLSIGNEENQIVLTDNGTDKKVDVKLNGNDINVGYNKNRKEVNIDGKRGNSINVSHDNKDDKIVIDNNGNKIDLNHNRNTNEINLNDKAGHGVNLSHGKHEQEINLNGHYDDIEVSHSRDKQEITITHKDEDIINVSHDRNDRINAEMNVDVDKDQILVSHHGLVNILKKNINDGTQVTISVWCPLGYRINIVKFIDFNGNSKIKGVNFNQSI